MSSARREFISNLATVQEAASHDALLNKPLTALYVQDNLRAQLLRRGLIVVAFATLEQFIKVRMTEALSAVSLTSLRFDDLPETMRVAATLGVIKAATVQASFAKGRNEPYINLIQDAALAVSSTASGSLSLHKYAFAHNQSNVSAEEVKQVLGAFNVHDPWKQITEVADRVGIGALPLEDAYINTHRLRNNAAHTPTANVEPSHISDFVRQATGIAIGFDVVISRASRLLRAGNAQFAKNGKVRLISNIGFRFIDESSKGYRECVLGKMRAVKLSNTREEAQALALQRAQRGFEVLVVRDKTQTPVEWLCTDLL